MSERHEVTGFTGADHRLRRPAVRAGAVAGTAAVLAAAGVGTATLLRAPSPKPATTGGPTAELITASASIPLPPPAILRLLGQHPDLGIFTDVTRRASCLNGLGYSASAAVLGGQQVDIGGRRAVLLVLAGDTPQQLHALVVPPSCSSASTGLIADTLLPRPSGGNTEAYPGVLH